MKLMWGGPLVVLAILMLVLPAYATTTWVGPSLGVSPSSIPTGGTVDLILSHVTRTTVPSPLAGWCPSTKGSFNGYALDQLRVTDPNGKIYLLGTSTKALSSGSPLLVGPTDTFSVPFGPGVGGFSLGVNGPLFWRTGGAALTPTGAVTGVSGTYVVDASGFTKCGTNIVPINSRWFFDITAKFTVPELAIGPAFVAAISLVGVFLIRKKLAPQMSV